MSKQKKKKVAAKNKAVEPKVESKKDSKIFGFELNTVLLVLGLVLVTAIVSTYAGYSIAQNNIQSNTSEVNPTIKLDVELVKTKTEAYLNDNFSQNAGVSFSLNQTSDLGSWIEFDIYAEDEGYVQFAGVAYANEEQLIIASMPALDLNTPLELPDYDDYDDGVYVQELTESEKEEIFSFNECLAEKGVVVYGANWCGYTNNLVENLGGFELVSPIYVECTQEEELCVEKEISGYPTVMLNGVRINPERTITGFATVTGCAVPEFLEGGSIQATAAGSC